MALLLLDPTAEVGTDAIEQVADVFVAAIGNQLEV
jgi:hypothetical protein